MRSGDSSPDEPTGLSSSNAPRTDARIGPYHLLQQLGEGGMGEVWLAEQQEPIRRRVALKVIKLGMDTKEVVARFESERQALALMDHPAIARVHDAGVTTAGRPFFVMEYVPGAPITEHCDRQRLSISQRLHLFQQVCAGVQHAHQKAVIHRDLKPSNVLIAVQDGVAAPKIIDFGIAKAAGARLSERTYFTELGIPIGTPEYMSPEQAELTGDIDTRSDVYSLGVMLYELLTGTRPFESATARSGGFEEIRRRIREEEPLKPSTRVSTVGGAENPRRRRTEAADLRRQLAGDLDWITMKALEKDRARRYGSPAELSADIDRHLTHQPVVAGPPTAAYRFRKFVRRHRLGVGVATAAALFVVALAVVMTVQTGRIARERDRANREAAAKTQVADFLKDLFKVADPAQARGRTITAREILDRGVKSLDEKLGEQPAMRAELLATLGDVYDALGLFREAETLMQRALDLRTSTLGESHPATLDSVHDLAWVLNRQGRYEPAAELFRRAFEQRRAELGALHADTLLSQGQLAHMLTRLGRLDEAEALFLEALDHQQRALGPHHENRLALMNNLAELRRRQKRYEDARKLDAEILDVRLRTLGEDHPLTLSTLNNLAVSYQDLGRYEDARVLIERAIGIAGRVFGTDHSQYGLFVHTLGELALANEDPAGAEGHLRQALDIYQRQPSHEYTGLVLYQLAQASARLKRVDEALAYLGRALDAGYAHNGTSIGFRDDPALASLHGHPRFDVLLAAAARRIAP